MEKIKVIYILGAGRSGSTLINTVLGQHEDAFACGELVHFAHPFMKDVHCSCGELFPACKFWSSVRKEWEKESGASAHDYLALQRHYEMYQTPYDKMNPLMRFLKEVKRAIWPVTVNDKKFEEYSQLTTLLFKKITECSGKTFIVDASKSWHRAYLLSEITDIDLYIFRLVRDGRGVARSCKKKVEKNYGWEWNTKPIPAWRSAIAWTRANFFCDAVLNKLSNFYFCRYEDFANQPVETLHAVGEWLRLDFSNVTKNIEAKKPLCYEHVFGGNHARMKPVLAIRCDDAWRRELSAEEIRQFEFFATPLLRKYHFLER
jgi:hypothetical protein